MDPHIRPADFFLEWEQFEMLNSIAGWMFLTFVNILIGALVVFGVLVFYWLLTDKDKKNGK